MLKQAISPKKIHDVPKIFQNTEKFLDTLYFRVFSIAKLKSTHISQNIIHINNLKFTYLKIKYPFS